METSSIAGAFLALDLCDGFYGYARTRETCSSPYPFIEIYLSLQVYLPRSSTGVEASIGLSMQMLHDGRNFGDRVNLNCVLGFGGVRVHVAHESQKMIEIWLTPYSAGGGMYTSA